MSSPFRRDGKAGQKYKGGLLGGLLHPKNATPNATDDLQKQRRKRFRILTCIDGSEDAFATLRLAARLATNKECDVIVLYVRSLDHGFTSGGLQPRVVRQNMLNWGFDAPGVRILKQAGDILREEGLAFDDWPVRSTHTDVWGDRLGDNKIEYHDEVSGQSVILKLKTSFSPATGILDQYELGPYNLIIVGEPSRWRGEFRSFLDAGVTQKITMRAPCSVLVARKASLAKTGFFICTDGSARSLDALRRAGVLAHKTRNPITLYSVAPTPESRAVAHKRIEKAQHSLESMGITVDETRIGVGDPARRIIHHGSGHKLIVVCDEGRNRLTRILKRSLVYEVVRRAHTSVLDVR